MTQKITEINQTSSFAEIPLEEITFSVVDVETTGFSPLMHRVIDIGVVKVKNGKIIDKWEALINPEQSITSFITYYTSITNDHVANAPIFKKLSNKIQKILKDTVFVAHNANFDYSFLRNEMSRCSLDFEYPKLCTVKLGRRLLPDLKRYNLDVLSGFYNINIENRHRALPDAKATAIILNNLINRAKELHDIKYFSDLEKIQQISTYRKYRNYRSDGHHVLKSVDS